MSPCRARPGEVREALANSRVLGCSYYGGKDHGGVYMSPQTYARVVNIVYKALNDNQLGFVKIVGPGKSSLSYPDDYVGACKGCMLSAWSTHPYEVTSLGSDAAGVP